jgi:hypothetical protein
MSVGGHPGLAGMLSSELASQKPPLHKFAVCDSRKVDDWAEAALPISVRRKSNRRAMLKHFEHESIFAPCQGPRFATDDLAARSALASRSP